jgi:hypothetical protein
MTEPSIVEREEIEVQYVSVPDGIEAIRRAWNELESAVGSLRGRRSFGAFYPATDEYRACVEVRDGDEHVPGLVSGALPGGRYADADPVRPSLEHYRRNDEIDCLLPVR